MNIHFGESHYSLGLLIGLPIFIIFIAAFIVAGLFLRSYSNSADVYDRSMVVLAKWFCWGLAGTLVIGALLGFYPYKHEYHAWQNVDGTVTSTNSRFLASNNGTDQKFVVTFKGSDQQFGCSDTRCSTIREGDWLEITCKRSFQWFGTPGYDCNFVDYKQKADLVQ